MQIAYVLKRVLYPDHHYTGITSDLIKARLNTIAETVRILQNIHPGRYCWVFRLRKLPKPKNLNNRLNPVLAERWPKNNFKFIPAVFHLIMARKRRISAFVELSCRSSGSADAINSGKILPASSLPS